MKFSLNRIAPYNAYNSQKTYCGKCNAKEDPNKERQELKGTTPSKEPERVREVVVTGSGASCLRKLAILIFRQSETNLLIKSEVWSRAVRDTFRLRRVRRKERSEQYNGKRERVGGKREGEKREDRGEKSEKAENVGLVGE